jgi:hypothetical protein
LYEAFKLVFVRGDEGPNRFGEMTPQHGSTLRRNSWLLTGTLLVFVIGILWPLSFINNMLSLSESVTEAGEAHISIRENLVAGDCIVVAAPIETGLSDSVQPYRYELVWPWEVVPDPIDVVSCGGNWDYKVLDTLVVDRSGTYPEVNYFEQLAYDRCPSESELYLYPFPELWELGDRTINCLQNY